MPSQPGQLLAGLRVALGAAVWVAPNVMGKLFGLDPKNNPQMSFMARLFGSRDIALGVGTTQTSGPSRRLWWQIGIVCDLVDAMAAYLGGRNGSMSKAAATLAGVTALSAAGLGIAAMNADDAV
jgi:hypothetical protein